MVRIYAPNHFGCELKLDRSQHLLLAPSTKSLMQLNLANPYFYSCEIRFNPIVCTSQLTLPPSVPRYVNRDREITKRYVQHAEKRGVKALFITVDAPQLGRREKDMRMKAVDDNGTAKVQDGQADVKKDQGVSRAISVCIPKHLPPSFATEANYQSFIDPSLSWKDIPWFRTITKSKTSPILCIRPLTMFVSVPIMLKGIATPEDALMAYDAGVQGIVLSNHGGRQLDTSFSGLENLPPIIAALKTRGPWPNPNFAVFVDGGVRRASDALKALALGASAVGIGRGFLYSFCAYGQEGVEKAIQLLHVS